MEEGVVLLQIDDLCSQRFVGQLLDPLVKRFHQGGDRGCERGQRDDDRDDLFCAQTQITKVHGSRLLHFSDDGGTDDPKDSERVGNPNEDARG